MFLRILVCATIIFFKAIFAAPFSEKIANNSEIEAPQASCKSTEWTDINYDDNVNSGPEYLEYEYDPSFADKKSKIDIFEDMTNDAKSQTFVHHAEQGETNVKNTLRPLPTPNSKMNINNKKSNAIRASEADNADHQTNDDEIQDMVANENSKILANTNQQIHKNSWNTNSSAENKTNQELHDSPHESNVQDDGIEGVNTQKAEYTPLQQARMQLPKSPKNITDIQENIANKSSMKHNSVTPTITLLPKITQPPYSSKDTTIHNLIVIEHSTLDSSLVLIPKNLKPITQESKLPIVQPIVSQDNVKTIDKVEEESDVSYEDLYKTLIQVQLAKTERLLRKIEAISNSEPEVFNSLEQNPNSVPHHKQIANNDKGDIFREGDTQLSRSTHITKDPIPQQPDKVIETHSTLSPSKIITDKQQTNERPLVDKIILENNIFKLVQPNLSSSIIPTASLAIATKSRNGDGGSRNYNPNSVSTSTSVAQQLGKEDSTGTFNSSKKIKLPNGSWTPSCKNVTKGKYCMKPDGEDQAIIECSGENVGFQFSCGGTMMCYSVGPHDVDCQNKK